MTLRSWLTAAKSKLPATLQAAVSCVLVDLAHELGDPEIGEAVTLCAKAKPQNTTFSKVKSLISKSFKMISTSVSK